MSDREYQDESTAPATARALRGQRSRKVCQNRGRALALATVLVGAADAHRKRKGSRSTKGTTGGSNNKHSAKADQDSGLDASAAAPAEPDKKRNKSKSSRRRKRKERKQGRASRGGSKNSDADAAAAFVERSLMTDGIGASMAALARQPRKVVRNERPLDPEEVRKADSVENTSGPPPHAVPAPGDGGDAGSRRPEDDAKTQAAAGKQKRIDSSTATAAASEGTPVHLGENNLLSSEPLAFTQEKGAEELKDLAAQGREPGGETAVAGGLNYKSGFGFGERTVKNEIAANEKAADEIASVSHFSMSHHLQKDAPHSMLQAATENGSGLAQDRSRRLVQPAALSSLRPDAKLVWALNDVEAFGQGYIMALYLNHDGKGNTNKIGYVYAQDPSTPDHWKELDALSTEQLNKATEVVEEMSREYDREMLLQEKGEIDDIIKGQLGRLEQEISDPGNLNNRQGRSMFPNLIEGQIDTLLDMMTDDLWKLYLGAPQTFVHVLRDADEFRRWKAPITDAHGSAQQPHASTFKTDARQWIKKYLHAGIFRDVEPADSIQQRTSYLLPFPDGDAAQRTENSQTIFHVSRHGAQGVEMQIVKYNPMRFSSGATATVYKDFEALRLLRNTGSADGTELHSEDPVKERLATGRLATEEVRQVMKVIECGPFARSRPHPPRGAEANGNIFHCLRENAHEILMNLLLGYGNTDTARGVAKLQRVVVSYAPEEELPIEDIRNNGASELRRIRDEVLRLPAGVTLGSLNQREPLALGNMLPTKRIRFTYFIEQVHIFPAFLDELPEDRRKKMVEKEVKHGVWPQATQYVRTFHKILADLDAAGYVLIDLKEVNMGFALDEKDEALYGQPKLLDFGQTCLTNRRDRWGKEFSFRQDEKGDFMRFEKSVGDVGPLDVVLGDVDIVDNNYDAQEQESGAPACPLCSDNTHANLQFWGGDRRGGTAGYLSPALTAAYQREQQAIQQAIKEHKISNSVEHAEYMRKQGGRGAPLKKSEWLSPRSDWFAASRVMLSQLGFDWWTRVVHPPGQELWNIAYYEQHTDRGGEKTISSLPPARVHFDEDAKQQALQQMTVYWEQEEQEALRQHLSPAGLWDLICRHIVYAHAPLQEPIGRLWTVDVLQRHLARPSFSSSHPASSSFAQLQTSTHPTNSTEPDSFLPRLRATSVFLQNPSVPAVDGDAVAKSQKEEQLLLHDEHALFSPKINTATSTATSAPLALRLPAPLETVTSELDVDQKQQQNASQPKSAGTRPSSVLLQTDTDDQKASSTSFLQGEQNTNNESSTDKLNAPPGGDRRLVDGREKSNTDDHTTTTSVGSRNPQATPALLPQKHEDAPPVDPLHPTFSAGRREGTTTSNTGAFTQLQSGAVHTQQGPVTQQMTRQNATAGGSSVFHDDMIKEQSAPAAAFPEHEGAFSKS
ncbi:unnamed protein product [Amoebophrya sp. A120]|nr:unnamed protein product [Amoebophrya sp. A120]|eukprot:GSA120T00019503001.1